MDCLGNVLMLGPIKLSSLSFVCTAKLLFRQRHAFNKDLAEWCTGYVGST